MRARLAESGQEICDANGVLFAVVARDIHRGATARPDDFVFADGHKPVFGEVIPGPVLDFLYGRGA
jgi:hypothetical protein